MTGAPGEPLDRALARAWAVRRAHFPDEITFAVPGMIRYDTSAHTNRRESFAAVSVTGAGCRLGCEHCRGRLLEGMIPVRDPGHLERVGSVLARRGASGILLTGGCDEQGRVPLGPFLPTVPALKALGLTVLAHTGLVTRSEAGALRDAGVDQVLADVVGDPDTAREVLHLDRGLDDHLRSLAHLVEAGLAVAPHVVVGLHFGRIRGEPRALEALGRLGVERLVLVALKPLPGTPMEGVEGPEPGAVAALAALARVTSPRARVSFGCARPHGPGRKALERCLVDAGVNSLAFPAEDTVRHAAGRGLRCRFVERCCSMA